MNKKELAEQILMKHIGEIDWPEFKEFGFLRKATAAIIEAMGEKPDKLTDEEIKTEAFLYAEGWGEGDDKTSFIEGAKWARKSAIPHQ